MKFTGIVTKVEQGQKTAARIHLEVPDLPGQGLGELADIVAAGSFVIVQVQEQQGRLPKPEKGE